MASLSAALWRLGGERCRAAALPRRETGLPSAQRSLPCLPATPASSSKNGDVAGRKASQESSLATQLHGRSQTERAASGRGGSPLLGSSAATVSSLRANVSGNHPVFTSFSRCDSPSRLPGLPVAGGRQPAPSAETRGRAAAHRPTPRPAAGHGEPRPPRDP